MTTDFATAWDAHDLGDYVAVSNGMPAPSNTGGVPWRHWRSHNFVGKITLKRDSAPRAIRFELAAKNGATVSYVVIEGTGHSFTPTDYAAFLTG